MQMLIRYLFRYNEINYFFHCLSSLLHCLFNSFLYFFLPYLFLFVFFFLALLFTIFLSVPSFFLLWRNVTMVTRHRQCNAVQSTSSMQLNYSNIVRLSHECHAKIKINLHTGKTIRLRPTDNWLLWEGEGSRFYWKTVAVKFFGSNQSSLTGGCLNVENFTNVLIKQTFFLTRITPFSGLL